MTEIEEEFTQVFGIKNITNGCEEYYYMSNEIPCKECEDKICLKDPKYSVITDRILLQLICLINDNLMNVHNSAYILKGRNFNELKTEILSECINYSKDIKKDVKALFESEV